MVYETHIIFSMAIIDYIQRQIFVVLNIVFLCSLAALFGIITNVINLLVFYKQGLKSSMNITFFAMAISDLCGMLSQELFSIFFNPLFEAADLPLVPSEFQYMIAGIPRVAFSKITCLITVYATLERCLCIAFPLHIKGMITARRTTFVMACIYTMTILSFSPLYMKTSINWKFHSDRNKTLLGLVFASGSQKLTDIVYVLQAFLGLSSFVAVVIFTMILIRQLGQKGAWRKTAIMSLDKSQQMSNRDRKTMTMIILIATILIICYTPSVILYCVTIIEPEFSIAGAYNNLFFALWSFGILFETINSSVNIFLYIKMSTQYRQTFYKLVSCLKTITENSGNDKVLPG
ncbi:unnamed protein product [Candidula unifasciata]|uniref:G-protein coupled receptors family 1 profile domain-containing protein n=1 Tax=Candidula unifasciata TaxID=100452 RepID=A0A8S3YIT3_9EUPU|nr:unnamed protein product [Candidula unifasciata]